MSSFPWARAIFVCGVFVGDAIYRCRILWAIVGLVVRIWSHELIRNSAHAGNAPWEGANALDAAFLAYSSVSVLRQQIRPDHRVNGVINGSERAANGTV